MTGTPLIFAALCGSTQACEQLLSCGASIDARNANGDTALMCASYCGHCSVVELFLAHNAQVNACNYTGANALMFATECGQLQTIEMLVEKGAANVLHTDQQGNTARVIAALKEYNDVTAYLEQREGMGGAVVATEL